MLYIVRVFFPFFILTWRASNFVSCQERGIIGEKKVPKHNLLLRVLTSKASHFSFFPTTKNTVVNKTISFTKFTKEKLFLIAVQYFPEEDGNSEE